MRAEKRVPRGFGYAARQRLDPGPCCGDFSTVGFEPCWPASAVGSGTGCPPTVPQITRSHCGRGCRAPHAADRRSRGGLGPAPWAAAIGRPVGSSAWDGGHRHALRRQRSVVHIAVRAKVWAKNDLSKAARSGRPSLNEVSLVLGGHNSVASRVGPAQTAKISNCKQGWAGMHGGALRRARGRRAPVSPCMEPCRA